LTLERDGMALLKGFVVRGLLVITFNLLSSGRKANFLSFGGTSTPSPVI